MGLADDLDRIPDGRALTCRVQAAVAEHPDDGDTIWHACTGRGGSAVAISEVLSRYGIDVSPQSIRRHRRGECACRTQVPERYQ